MFIADRKNTIKSKIYLHRENFEVFKIQRYIKNVVGCSLSHLVCEVNFELYNGMKFLQQVALHL